MTKIAAAPFHTLVNCGWYTLKPGSQKLATGKHWTPGDHCTDEVSGREKYAWWNRRGKQAVLHSSWSMSTSRMQKAVTAIFCFVSEVAWSIKKNTLLKGAGGIKLIPDN